MPLRGTKDKREAQRKRKIKETETGSKREEGKSNERGLRRKIFEEGTNNERYTGFCI